MFKIVLLIWIPLAFPQTIDITEINKHQKVVRFRLGPARIITNHNNLIHIVNLDEYTKTVNKIQDTVSVFENTHRTTSLTKVTRLKLKELENKVQTLTPHKRHKRGLINGLGTTVKFITENMDANDALSINKQMQDIKTNTTHIETILNNQNQINSIMPERLHNVTIHINKEQDKIEAYINKIANNILKGDDQLFELQYISQINYNIDLLNNHLESIAESIVLAKLNVISKFILSTTELDQIYNYMENQSIEISSKEQIYELLGLQAYYNNSNIIFNVQIPNVSKENYELYHILPLPLNNTKKIKIKPYLTYNKNHIQFFNEPCPRVENTYYCKKSPYTEYTTNSNCIGQIISNKDALCDLEDVGNINLIIQPEPNYILFINTNKTTVTTSCNNDTYEVKGTALLYYNNCSINVNGEIYKDNPMFYRDELFLPLISYSEVNAKTITNKLSLDKLRSYQLENHEATSKKNKIIILTTCSLSIIFTAALVYIARIRTKFQFTPDLQLNVPAPTSSLWPSLYSKGGGVMETPITQPPTKPPRLHI